MCKVTMSDCLACGNVELMNAVICSGAISHIVLPVEQIITMFDPYAGKYHVPDPDVEGIIVISTALPHCPKCQRKPCRKEPKKFPPQPMLEANKISWHSKHYIPLSKNVNVEGIESLTTLPADTKYQHVVLTTRTPSDSDEVKGKLIYRKIRGSGPCVLVQYYYQCGHACDKYDGTPLWTCGKNESCHTPENLASHLTVPPSILVLVISSRCGVCDGEVRVKDSHIAPMVVHMPTGAEDQGLAAPWGHFERFPQEPPKKK